MRTVVVSHCRIREIVEAWDEQSRGKCIQGTFVVVVTLIEHQSKSFRYSFRFFLCFFWTELCAWRSDKTKAMVG